MPDRPLLSFVLPLAIAQTVAWGTIYYGYALFLLPMEAELGFSRAETSGAFSLGLFVAALLAVPVGRWIDRRGGRALMAGGSVASAGLLLLWSRVETLWQLQLVWAAMGAALAATLYEPVFAVVRRACGPRYGRGILIITFVAGFAGTVGFPTAYALIEALGWRLALVAIAALNFLVCAPIYWFVIDPDAPSDDPPSPDPAGPQRAGALGRALRLPVFWVLALAFVLSNLTFGAVSFAAIPTLVERGFPAGTAVALMSLVGPSQVLGRVALLGLLGRVPAAAIGTFAYVAPILGLALFALAEPGHVIIWAFPLFYGLGLGLKTIVQATAGPEFIGEVGYGAIQGAFGTGAALARAAGPSAAAWVGTVGGSPAAVGLAFIALACSAFAVYVGAVLLKPRSDDAGTA